MNTNNTETLLKLYELNIQKQSHISIQKYFTKLVQTIRVLAAHDFSTREQVELASEPRALQQSTGHTSNLADVKSGNDPFILAAVMLSAAAFLISVSSVVAIFYDSWLTRRRRRNGQQRAQSSNVMPKEHQPLTR